MQECYHPSLYRTWQEKAPPRLARFSCMDFSRLEAPSMPLRLPKKIAVSVVLTRTSALFCQPGRNLRRILHSHNLFWFGRLRCGQMLLCVGLIMDFLWHWRSWPAETVLGHTSQVFLRDPWYIYTDLLQKQRPQPQENWIEGPLKSWKIRMLFDSFCHSLTWFPCNSTKPSSSGASSSWGFSNMKNWGQETWIVVASCCISTERCTVRYRRILPMPARCHRQCQVPRVHVCHYVHGSWHVINWS